MATKRNKDRNALLDKVLIDGNLEYDYLSGPKIDFDDFGEEQQFRVTERYVGRLDLLSYRIYGTVSLWWLIALRNDIVLPDEDMFVGQIVVIPSSSQYFDFFNKNSVVEEEIDAVFTKRELDVDA